MRQRSRDVRFSLPLATGVALFTLASAARGIVVEAGDGRNTAPPTGGWVDAWNLSGQFGQFTATPISDRHILTAAHIGSHPGSFTFRGRTYATKTPPVTLPGTDLRIWTIDTSADPTLLPAWASLWDRAADGSEIGRPFTVVGRGVPRAAAIYAPIDAGPTLFPVSPTPLSNSPAVQLTGGLAASSTLSLSHSLNVAAPVVSDELHGWTLGTYDGQLSWGRNRVDAIETDDTYGELLRFDFDRSDRADALEHEAGVVPMDSGGGGFIQAVTGEWKLAGVNLGAALTYAATPEALVDPAWEDSRARNALVDLRNLYTYVADGPDADTLPDVARVGGASEPIGATAWASSVAASRDALLAAVSASGGTLVPANGPTMVPEPIALPSLLASLAGFAARRRRQRP